MLEEGSVTRKMEQVSLPETETLAPRKRTRWQQRNWEEGEYIKWEPLEVNYRNAPIGASTRDKEVVVVCPVCGHRAARRDRGVDHLGERYEYAHHGRTFVNRRGAESFRTTDRCVSDIRAPIEEPFQQREDDEPGSAAGE